MVARSRRPGSSQRPLLRGEERRRHVNLRQAGGRDDPAVDACRTGTSSRYRARDAGRSNECTGFTPLLTIGGAKADSTSHRSCHAGRSCRLTSLQFVREIVTGLAGHLAGQRTQVPTTSSRIARRGRLPFVAADRSDTRCRCSWSGCPILTAELKKPTPHADASAAWHDKPLEEAAMNLRRWKL